MRLVAVLVLLAGCDVTLSAMDQIYSHGADHPVLCAFNVDNKNAVSADSIAAGLDRAQAEHVVLHIYTHRPEGTVDESTIEQIVAGAADRGMPFVTYRDLVAGTATEGLALSFDDHDIGGWHALRPMFDLYGAKVTFFISAFHVFDDNARMLLRDLFLDGHSIDYHSTEHRNAETYSAEFGVERYIADDIVPDLELMRADGYDPTTFAYPFGARTAATDAALLKLFPLVRASSFDCPH
ncbi:MAG TPA: polysaccharide deacetylase family protein [Kofleriaceae bacterium]|nr:polysaccharide deacetylase family protein [Kofleriaceae bacterium]